GAGCRVLSRTLYPVPCTPLFMSSLVAFYRSSIGKKVIMAVTGLIGIGYVIVHMAGNLQAFLGARKINSYGALLHGPLAELTWLVRIVIFVAVVLHVLMAY